MRRRASDPPAHQRDVIQRDLEPGRVLVTQAGQPKVLDFGVARLTDSGAQLTTLHTDMGQVLGTLPFMSLEQTAAESLELDTRSDVYSLGVILYELLAGLRQFADAGLAPCRVVAEEREGVGQHRTERRRPKPEGHPNGSPRARR